MNTSQDMKVKERVSPDQLKTILRQWLEALDEDKDLEVNFKGGTCRVPKEAFKSGKTVAEFEIDEGEYEFELELKWRPSETQTQPASPSSANPQ